MRSCAPGRNAAVGTRSTRVSLDPAIDRGDNQCAIGCFGSPAHEPRPVRIPIIRGVIDRRILVNFRVDAAVLAKLLPEPFRPKLVAGAGIAGVCLIRLKQIRPRFFPRGWRLLRKRRASNRRRVGDQPYATGRRIRSQEGYIFTVQFDGRRPPFFRGSAPRPIQNARARGSLLRGTRKRRRRHASRCRRNRECTMAHGFRLSITASRLGIFRGGLARLLGRRTTRHIRWHGATLPELVDETPGS